jgi:protein transport protein SEC24
VSGTNQVPPANMDATGQQQQARYKIHPDQIPNPLTVQLADQEAYLSTPYITSSRTTPPMASSQFVAYDEGIFLLFTIKGNCNPRFMRATANSLPLSDDLMKSAGFPLGLVLQPLAELDPRETPIQLVDFGENGPIRCDRCKAYINPYFLFTDGGRKFVCNICSFENSVPTEYFSNLDMNGRRLDVQQRPELSCGSVEFVASKVLKLIMF